MATLDMLMLRAETGEQCAHICKLEAQALALVARHGIRLIKPQDVELTPGGELASVYVGQDDDGMARYILNFAL